ncbi:Pellicle/biofilm biosynthesis outer membrane lipoprotein PelC [hydrothermal vent metagenome]|uniref:Pellicle/biofilm biosynthesis outer membrane lipoprotein PelC n=1 Tax=hydrothermal vent metagenome TaxID=652676 RepID=A0A3B1BNM1_9ZZZZ
MQTRIKTAWKIIGLGLIFLLNACSVEQIYHGKALDNQASWVLLPVVNRSQTPQAGERVEAILVSLLRSRGVTHISHYPGTPQSQVLIMLDEQARYNAALKWALTQGFRYAITGTVEEWRYKAGLDGEPAVGITLRVIDLQNNKKFASRTSTTSEAKYKTQPVLWSATGARTGWGREGIATATHTLLNDLLDGIVFVEQGKQS